MIGQAYEAVTGLHLSPFRHAAASWVVTGQNQSLVLFLSASVEVIGQNLKRLPLASFSEEVTGQILNHACSEPSLPVVIDDDQDFYLMMSRAFFWSGMNLTKNNC